MQNVHEVLGHVADGTVLFHNGLWGGPAGFVWAATDGTPAGRVPQWETDVLMLAERRGLVAIGRGVGSQDARVDVTPAGRTLLSHVA